MSETVNQIAQWAGVAILVALAVVYILGWIRGRKSSCDCCELKDSCSKNKSKKQ